MTFWPGRGHPLKMVARIIASRVLHRRSWTRPASDRGQTKYLKIKRLGLKCVGKKNNGSVMTSKYNPDFVLFRKLITTRSSQNKSCTIWLIKGMSCGSHSTSSEILIHIMSSKFLLYFRITSNTYFWGPIPQTVSADCITKAPLRPRGHETIGGTADHAGFRLVLLLVAVSVLQNRTLIEYKLTAVSSKIWCMSLNSIDHDS